METPGEAQQVVLAVQHAAHMAREWQAAVEALATTRVLWDYAECTDNQEYWTTVLGERALAAQLIGVRASAAMAQARHLLALWDL